MSNAFDDVILDAFGQNDRLSRLYTQLCFCFSLPDASLEAQDAIVASLKNGLSQLSGAFPWIAGQVVQDDSGVFKISPWKTISRLLVRDLRDQLPSMQEYRDTGFPFSELDERIIAPRGTLPERFSEPAEVFLLQANFIEGGLLLVMMGQHDCMDMAGLGQVIYLFSKACRREEFSEAEIRTCNLPRRNIIPIDHGNATPNVSKNVSNQSKSTATHMTEHKTQWIHFLFSESSMSKLNEQASTALEGVSFVSTDDIVSAILWQAWTRARTSTLAISNESSTFQRQVNVRRHLGLPAEYTGMAVYTVSTTLAASDLCESSIGYVASELRKTLESTDLEAGAKAAAAKSLKSTASAQSTSRPKLPPFDIKMSSWAKEKCYELEFGPGLGRPEAVRRPSFEAWDGLAYLLPKRLDGEIAAAICIREDDLEHMKSDAYLSRFARFVE